VNWYLASERFRAPFLPRADHGNQARIGRSVLTWLFHKSPGRALPMAKCTQQLSRPSTSHRAIRASMRQYRVRAKNWLMSWRSRVRSGGAGRHYTSTGQLPLIPGVDGVGKWLMEHASTSSLTTSCPAPWPRRPSWTRRLIRLREDADELKIAAAMNSAMSSWVALRRRVFIQSGQRVLAL
jgi:hypothetical protein